VDGGLQQSLSETVGDDADEPVLVEVDPCLVCGSEMEVDKTSLSRVPRV
jgi:hypothetical protein